MLPRADLAGVRALGQVEAATPVTPLGDARQESFNRLAQIAIGKQFQAQILSRLNDGTFLVRVADTIARMNLPPGMASGESVELTLVSAEPRPTFTLGQQGGGPTVSIDTSGRQAAQRFVQMSAEPDLAAGKAALPGIAESVASKATLVDLAQTTLGKAALAAFSQAPIGKEALAALASTPLGKDLVRPDTTLADLAETPQGRAALATFGASAIGKATLLALADTEPGKAALAEIGATALAKLGLSAAPAAQPAPAAPGGVPTSLSETGRLINQILRAAGEEGAPAAIVGKTPLIQVPGAAVPHLTAALKDALVFSGLFYEAHVAQWAEGERPIAELLREPQAALRAAAVAPAVADAPGRAPLAGAELGSTFATALSPNAANLINLQLAALENNRVLWQGELFPGQRMEWEVSRDAPERHADQETPAWNSAVCFELPLLGQVSANIRLSGERVQVQVRTASDDAAAALRAHGAELASALQSAGAPLDLLTVSSDGKA